jgi:hypothetical protein
MSEAEASTELEAEQSAMTEESPLDRVVRIVGELHHHVVNAQLDIDWLREHFGYLRNGVQGLLDQQGRKDEQTNFFVAQQAKIDERVRWLTWLTIVPNALLTVIGALTVVLLGIKVVSALVMMTSGGQALALW